MANGNAPSQDPKLLIIGGLVLLLILCCSSSVFVSYSRVGNINIFSSSGGLSAEEIAYAQAHGGALPPGSSSMADTGSSAFGLLDAFGVKQNCKVGPWGEWSACDANCGTQAHRRRTRQVVTPAKNGGSCPYPLVEEDLCTNLPPCEVPALNGQYEPCPNGSYLLDSYCAVEIPTLSASECEKLKQDAVLGAVSLGAYDGGGVDQNQAAIAATAVGGAVAAGAVLGGSVAAAAVTGPALILTAGIMAAVAAAEVDCDAYVCPPGWHDTRVNRRCDHEAQPKCPPGGYTWDWTRRMCIMPSTGPLPSAAPAPASRA